MNTNLLDDTAPGLPTGKQRLIDAALRLAAREGTVLSSLGLRELAREAGLNHNTFYRHFSGVDDLGRAAAATIASQLMAALKDIRQHAARHADATVGAVNYFLDFARDNPDLIIVGLRELHSYDSPMRKTMQKVLEDIASDSVEQIVSMDLVRGLNRDALKEATSAITYFMFYMALNYIDQPKRRVSIRDQIVRFIRSQFLGHLTLTGQANDPVSKRTTTSRLTRR